MSVSAAGTEPPPAGTDLPAPARTVAGGWLRLEPPRTPVGWSERVELAFFVGILLLALLTPPWTAAGAANAPFAGWLEEHTGGGLCVYRRVSGIECGGCGLTRGFVQLAHGDVLAAIRLNPLTPAVFAWVSWRVVELVVLVGWGRRLRHGLPHRWVWRAYGAVGLGFFLLALHRLGHGFGWLS